MRFLAAVLLSDANQSLTTWASTTCAASSCHPLLEARGARREARGARREAALLIPHISCTRQRLPSAGRRLALCLCMCGALRNGSDHDLKTALAGLVQECLGSAVICDEMGEVANLAQVVQGAHADLAAVQQKQSRRR